MNNKSELVAVSPPDIRLPDLAPEFPASVYLDRIDRLKDRARSAGFGFFVVYGDREHSANLRYLTGYDPRFEEALLLLNLDQADSFPMLLAGNEGYGYAGSCPIRDSLDLELFQSLSLLGQSRTESRTLSEILRERGVTSGTRVGTAGWKHYSADEIRNEEIEDHETAIEIPGYFVDLLRTITGGREFVRNANALFMDTQTGLRLHNELEQLAWFEFAGSYASNAVKNVIQGLRIGMSEYEAATLMKLNGIPLSCHPMLSAGERAYFGMGSPSSRPLGRREPFTTAVGLWGALTSRAGFLVESSDELPVADYVDKLVGPYFSAISAWYEHIGVGVTGGELFEIIDSRIGDEFYGVGLNPGHQIHLDEWVNSPVYRGSTKVLESSMAFQVDVIPATGGPYYTSNIEDGVLLADAMLRERFSAEYPDAWKRIETRRAYMKDVLGITLKPEVLPTSSIPAWLPPYLLDTSRAMALVGR
jgi:hypothetical protein